MIPAGAALLMLVAGATAQAQTTRTWAVTVEGGVSDLHGKTAADGPGGAVRLSRRLMGYGWLRGELALTGGSADVDRGFGTAELGIELRLCSACRVAAFVGGGGGYLKEAHWDGGLLRANAGVESRVSDRLSVRLMAQAGMHDGVRGPHLATMGLVWRFGSRGGPATSASTRP